MAALIALIAVAAGGALGHAGAIAPALSVPLRALHIVAVAVWMGGLLALVSALRAGAAPVAFVRTVSNAALWSFIVVALSGLAQVLVLLRDPLLLATTAYGRVALVKVTGLLALGAFGLYHRRLIDRLDRADAAGALRASTTREIVLFIGIIVVSAALAFTPLPE
jgi:putative copper resistance protein D